MEPENQEGSSNRVEAGAVLGETQEIEGRESNSVDSSAGQPGQGRKATEKRGDDRTSPDPAAQPAKRSKRGRYISRACTTCQQRKVKCDGGEPCAQCIARNQPCVSALRDRPATFDQRGRSFSMGETQSLLSVHGSADGRNSTAELLARLAEVERRLNMIPTSALDAFSYKKDQHYAHPHVVAMDDNETSPPTDLQNVLESDGQTFAGEISIDRGLQDVDDKIDDIGRRMLAEYSSGSPLRNTKSSGDASTRKVRAWLETILDHHGIVADEAEWRRYMHVFFEEIHVLYPCLHPPSVWETFHELWEFSALWPLANSAEREQKRLSVALVCFCLALGRCTVSSRVTDASGIHSSGWAFYSVGMSLLQDTAEMNNTAAKSLLALQTLLIRVIYLFRLDAPQRAARLLALAVCNAHIIGLHRQSTLDNMPVFSSQMSCRAWWCIYVLDRRLGLESGRPCLIHDSNMDTSLPMNLSDEWLTRFVSRSEKTAQLQEETTMEMSSKPVTPIPYLSAMVRYSKVVGKAWELLYGVKTSNSISSAMVEYADNVLCNLMETIPESLSYDPKVAKDEQFGNRLRWQVKQSMLLFTCTNFLRLLVRRPFSPKTKSFAGQSQDDEIESVAVCATLAASILNAHESMQDAELKYCFPFSHYLTSSTMVMIGLCSREPSLKRRYRSTILAATRSLNIYCHRIWVSGSMMRWVSRLTALVQRVLGEEPSDEASRHFRDGSSAGQDQIADDLQRITPPPSEDANFPHTAKHSGNIPPEARKPEVDNSSAWMMGTDLGPPELPEWVMSDFNFESIISGDGGGPKFPPSSGMSVAPQDNGSLLQSDSIDIDQLMFNALGGNCVFNLEMDLDEPKLGLFNPANSGF